MDAEKPFLSGVIGLLDVCAGLLLLLKAPGQRFLTRSWTTSGTVGVKEQPNSQQVEHQNAGER